MTSETFKTPTRLTFVIYDHLKAQVRWQTAQQIGIACGCTRGAANDHCRLLADAAVVDRRREALPNKFRIAQNHRTINPELTAKLDHFAAVYRPY